MWHVVERHTCIIVNKKKRETHATSVKAAIFIFSSSLP